MQRRSKIVGAVGIALVAVALLWWAAAVPRLVKYPTDIDASPQYKGTFTVYVDPASAAPLATPLQVPLTIDRHIKANGSQSGADRVLVDETIDLHAGTLVNTTQHNVYVMDRSTLANVADPRAYAFDPANVVDRSGAYRLNLPFDTSTSNSYPIYKNEIAATYQMQGDSSQPTTREAGLDLQRFVTSVSDAPLSAAYVNELSKAVPLPSTLTLDQLKPQLKQMGVDVDALLAAMTPYLTPDDLATLMQIAGNPIGLKYVASFEGNAAVEPTTGAEVDVGVKETVGAHPVMPDLPALQTILTHYPNVPEAKTASDALAKLSTAPAVSLFSYDYQQTPESVADIGGQVSSMRNQIRLVRIYIPYGLLFLGIIGVAAAALMFFQHRHELLHVRHEPPELERIPEPEKALTEGGHGDGASSPRHSTDRVRGTDDGTDPRKRASRAAGHRAGKRESGIGDGRVSRRRPLRRRDGTGLLRTGSRHREGVDGDRCAARRPGRPHVTHATRVAAHRLRDPCRGRRHRPRLRDIVGRAAAMDPERQ